jgi:peptidoglycan/xylan/chitin deacetylase (PgdA/CDA1 family)
MIGWFSAQVFMGPAQRRLMQRGVAVYCFHKIGQPPRTTLDPFLYVTPKRFDEQLGQLRSAGYTTASLGELTNAQGGRKAIVTFDDGCADVLEQGLEILARHKFRAIQFLVSGFLGKRNEWDIEKGDVPEQLMDEAQVREWLKAGHEIGSHSVTHRNFRRLNEADALAEIRDSKKALEDRFGVKVEHFCYPFGGWNPRLSQLVQEAGYRTACTMEFGVNGPPVRAFELRRIIPLSNGEFLAKVRHRLGRKMGAK